MASTYKNVLNTSLIVSKPPSGTSYSTVEEALLDYKEMYYQSKCKVHECSEMCAPAFVQVNEILTDLKSYWSEFGFLNKATPKTFRAWVTKNIHFTEIITLPITVDDTDQKTVDLIK